MGTILATKSERVESTGRSRGIGLRSGSRKYAVILGVFVNDGYGETVTLAQVFQQRESIGQPYRFFVTAGKELSIAADFADFGSDLRDLRRRLRAAGTAIYDEFPKYSTASRRLLGIRSEQALELFHQTVSMKSVGNLNDFVRDHLLEPSDATERVREIIAHFEDLTKAHDAVKRAREQLAALAPIVATASRYNATVAERDGLELERAAVRLFIAELRSVLLAEEIAGLEENEITYLSVPVPDDGVVIWGKGFDVDKIGRLPWLTGVQVVYWGDLDTHGFAILDRLRAWLPQTRSVLMDRRTLLAHRDRWGREDRPTAAQLNRLDPAEAELYADLVTDTLREHIRLEQERVDWSWAEAELLTAMRGE